jgi:hypothetical protein
MDDGNLQGTLLISAVANDGILMSSDSRMGMSSGDQISAYADGSCKITLLKKFPIMYSPLLGQRC